MSCTRSDRVMLYALQTLPAEEMSATGAHLLECAECRRRMEELLPVVDSFVAWPNDVLRPTAPLWGRLTPQLLDATASGARDRRG